MKDWATTISSYTIILHEFKAQIGSTHKYDKTFQIPNHLIFKFDCPLLLSDLREEKEFQQSDFIYAWLFNYKLITHATISPSSKIRKLICHNF